MTVNSLISPDHLIRVHDRTFRPYITREEIRQMVHDIATRINHDLNGEEVTALVILKGAMIFASDLVRSLNMPVTIEFCRASSYGHGIMSTGSLEIDGLFTDVADKNVLIIEDIVDTGTTIRELIKHISGLQPKSITIASLLSKPTIHSETLTIDYVGREIAPGFVVGYGMDYAGQGRQLDAIWVLVDEPSA